MRGSARTIVPGTAATDTFSYDAEGDVTSESQQIPGLTSIVAVTDQYTGGNRTQLGANIGGTPDFLNNYEYTFSASDNLFGQMSQVTQSGQEGGNTVADKTVTFSYLADGQFSGIARYASSDTSSGLVATSAYNYNAAEQIISLTHTAADLATYAAYTWTYNASGEVASFANGATIADYSAEDIGALSYDATEQLTGAAPPGDGAPNAENSLTNVYDESGNATNLNGAATAVGADNTLASDGTYADKYDADGNLVEQSNSTTRIFYAYDNRNRLTSVVTQVYSGCEWFTTSSVNYVYDAFNDLVARTGDTVGAPPIVDIELFSQFFIYDGANQVLALGADGAVANRYLWGPGVNQLLADDNYALGLSSPTLWTLGDNQNSIRDLVSSDGTLQQHIAYSPFGQQIVTAAGAFSTEAVCVFGYTGSFTDVVTGDVLNGVRWYDPSSERWLTQDPAAAEENLYRYCGNGPTDGTDPSGLEHDYSLSIDENGNTTTHVYNWYEHGPSTIDAEKVQNPPTQVQIDHGTAVPICEHGKEIGWKYPNADMGKGYTLIALSAQDAFFVVGPGGVYVHRCVYNGGKNEGHDTVNGGYLGTSTNPRNGEVTKYSYDPTTGELTIEVYDNGKDRNLLATQTMKAPKSPECIPSHGHVTPVPR